MMPPVSIIVQGSIFTHGVKQHIIEGNINIRMFQEVLVAKLLPTLQNGGGVEIFADHHIAVLF